MSERETVDDGDSVELERAQLEAPSEPTYVLRLFATALLFFYGVYLPLATLLLAVQMPPLKPDWQSGTLSARAAMYLQPDVVWPFYPLIAAAITGFTLLLFFPRRFIHVWFVRMALFSGVPIALFFLVTLALIFFPGDLAGAEATLTGVIVVASVVVLSVAIRKGLMRVEYDTTPASIGLRLSVSIGIAILLTVVMQFFFLNALTSPLSTLMAYGLLSDYVIRCRGERWRFSLARCFALMTWAMAILAAWRQASLRAEALYAQLPTEPPPDCYVCTAAARGHPGFVGSWRVQASDGKSCRVNRQLQRIKLAELATARRLPRLHHFCRVIYDRLGPALARSIRNPYLADMTYVALKPCEWAARLWVLFV